MESLELQPTTSSSTAATASHSVPMLSPSSTIVRVKRKRSAGPLSGLVVSSKRAKAALIEEDGGSQPARAQPVRAEPIEEFIDSSPTKDADVIFLSHVGTSNWPHAKSVAPFLKTEHKVVEMIDYNPESGSLGKRKLSVLDHGYLEVMRAAKAISDFGLDERERKEFESASTAPLAKGEFELLDEFDGDDTRTTEDAALKGPVEGDYVYDFYCTPHNQITLFPETCSGGSSGPNGLQVRLPTDEELQLYFGGDNDDESCEGGGEDEDSNAECHYRNDYPDEQENDTTSDDDEVDDYDHYGSDNEEYEKHLCRGDQGAPDSDDE